MQGRRENQIAEFKVVILGEARVGKSSIINRFIKDKFDQITEKTVIGAQQAFCEKIMEVFNGGKVKINLWDTAGQEVFSSIVAMYYKQARAAIIVFDLTDSNTVVKAHKWIKEVQNNTDAKDCKLILVGNKADKSNDRQVSTAEGQQMAAEYKIKYYETSAKNSLNIKELFQDLSEELYRENRNTTKRPTRIEINNDNFIKDEPITKTDKKKLDKDKKDKKDKKEKSGGCCS